MRFAGNVLFQGVQRSRLLFIGDGRDMLGQSIPFIGGRNRVYEVLARKRPLTLKMIWRLHKGLGIPAESLIKGGQQKAA